MTEFAKLKDDALVRFEDHSARPDPIAHKQTAWYPVARSYGEPFEGVSGDTYIVRTVDPATLPPPVPPQISDRQFFHMLALNEAITQEEALAAVKTGDIPAALMALVAAMPEEDRFNAEMLLSGATVFERNHPLTNALGAAMGYSAGQVDDLFRAAGAL